MANFFDKNEGANIGTNSQEAQEIIEKIELCLSLDTNVPLNEAFDIAFRKLFEQENLQTKYAILRRDS